VVTGKLDVREAAANLPEEPETGETKIEELELLESENPEQRNLEPLPEELSNE